MHIVVYAYTYSTYMYVHATCTFQCTMFPLVYGFALFVVEYHPISVTLVVSEVSCMPPSIALLTFRVVKPADC